MNPLRGVFAMGDDAPEPVSVGRPARLKLVRVSYGREPEPGSSVMGPEHAGQVLRLILPQDREAFAVLFLNARHKCTGCEVISVGSLNASIVHPREVFKGAILAGACSIIIGHNHPSGDPDPSEEDLTITRRLVYAGTLMGIQVLDHVIVGRRGVVSLRERGHL